ncbi:MAG TPA: isoprenylcysteine carboxylmethyltransferase family protein [Candidatus Obscuribacterales bacterium]
MVNDGILLLCLINFGFIALLPRKFFKQGAKLGAHFWMTAAPLFACPAFLGLAKIGILPPIIGNDTPWGEVSVLIGVCFATLSILLLGMAIGTHRVPLHMFHDQADSSVSHLVTYGPYRYIRHPIYASYLLALVAGFLCCLQIGTLLCLAYGLIVLNRTAAQEEQRLSQSSEFGPEYAQYMKESGRFLPPLHALRLSEPQAKNEAERGEPQQKKVAESSASSSAQAER